MAAITDNCTVELVQGATHAKKELIVTTPNTADTADTVVVNLNRFACTKLETIVGCVHTTENSVVVLEAPTTVVSAGLLTITLGGTLASDKKRVYRITIAN